MAGTFIPDLIRQQKTHFSSLIMKTVCLKVNVSSAKMNVLFDGALTEKVKLFFLISKEIPDYFLENIISNT